MTYAGSPSWQVEECGGAGVGTQDCLFPLHPSCPLVSLLPLVASASWFVFFSSFPGLRLPLLPLAPFSLDLL